jgi:hypothetical protein
MRYLIQFLVPAMIVIVVALIVLRGRARPQSGTDGEDQGPISTGAFIVILVIGAVFTIAVVYGVEAWLG